MLLGFYCLDDICFIDFGDFFDQIDKRLNYVRPMVSQSLRRKFEVFGAPVIVER